MHWDAVLGVVVAVVLVALLVYVSRAQWVPERYRAYIQGFISAIIAVVLFVGLKKKSDVPLSKPVIPDSNPIIVNPVKIEDIAKDDDNAKSTDVEINNKEERLEDVRKEIQADVSNDNVDDLAKFIDGSGK